ncbi:MAG: TraB/GumN family protein [Thermoplasmatota archaeon]
MITLVGIGHVFSIRKAVKYVIFQKRPDAVCLELDRLRFDALEKGELSDPNAPFIYKRLRKIYEKAAQTQGAEVGEEMMGGAEAANELGIPYYFIDVEATPMVADVFDKLTLGQKLKLFGSVLGASVLPKKTLEDGIKKIGDDPDAYMKEFEKAFPQLKKDIVDYRDKYMSSRILQISKDHMHVLAIVGEGHVSGMTKYLEPYGLEVLHLRELKVIAEKIAKGEIQMPEAVGDGGEGWEDGRNDSVEFSFSITPGGY